MKRAVLYRAHKLSPTLVEELLKLRNTVLDHDLYVLGYSRKNEFEDLADFKCIVYDQNDLQRLPYRRKLDAIDWNNPIGHNDMPVMQFFRDFPDYDEYWIIEYDVRYTGIWSDILSDLNCSSADLLATTIMDFDELPSWPWWSSLENKVKTWQLLKAFLPFCRLTNRLLREIDDRYVNDWGGHYEVAWPSIAKASGYSVEDIGGAGRYTPNIRKGKYYQNNPQHWALFPGTFIFRPTYKTTDVNEWGHDLTGLPMLWHPVK